MMSGSDKRCCVPGCVGSEEPHQNLHKFPNPDKDRKRFNIWVMAVGGDILGLTNEHIHKRRRVCNKHFPEKYLCRNGRISNIAVPTLNIPVCETVIPDISDVKSEPQIYTCVENKEDFLENAPENPDYYSDHLSMYCDDNTPLIAVKQDKDGDIHEGFQCDICNGVIIGFRYTCVECSRFDLCIACESSGAHDEHYMLRIPASKSRNKAEAIVSKIRSYLETEVNLFPPVVISDICSIRLSENCKALNSNEHEQTDIKPFNTNVNVSEETIPEDKTNSQSDITLHDILNEKLKPLKSKHIKKPLNAFMLYLKEKRAKMKAETSVLEMQHLNKHIGRQWRNLSDEEKSVYYNKATEEARLHKLKYPNWKGSRNLKIKRRSKYLIEPLTHIKCRKMYGLTCKELWCKGCRRKKKCQREKNFLVEDKDKDSSTFRTYSKHTPHLKLDLQNPEENPDSPSQSEF